MSLIVTKKLINIRFIIKLPFTGCTQSVIQYFEDGTDEVMYSDGLSFKQYCAKNSEKTFRLVNDKELDQLMADFMLSLNTDPNEVTEETYNFAIGEAGPCRYQNYGSGTAFHMEERSFGNNVDWYVEKSERYYTFANSALLSKDSLVEIIDNI